MNVYAIFDLAAQTYGNPFYMANNAIAIRTFHNEVKRADDTNVMYTNPADFELWRIGIWDNEQGNFLNDKERIARATDQTEA